MAEPAPQTAGNPAPIQGSAETAGSTTTVSAVGVSSPTPPTPASRRVEEPTWLMHLRHWTALAVVLVAAIGFVSLRATDTWQSCTTKVTTRTGLLSSHENTSSCDEVSLTVLVPVLILLIALMWPDIAEVELFGLGSVKRRLSEQDLRQNQLEASQQRLENQLVAQVHQNAALNQSPVVHQSPVFNIATNAADAQLVEGIVDQQRARNSAGEPAQDQTARTNPEEQRQLLDERGAQLRPWLNVARRMNDQSFTAAVRRGAASGTPSDDPQLIEGDKELLRQVERPGHPFDVEELASWAQENALALDAVRDTLSAGDIANPESIRVAAKFADQLFSDLQRRELVASA